MKQLAYAIAVIAAAPMAAQDGPEGGTSEGFDLLREGSRMLLEQLFKELGPKLEDLEGFSFEFEGYEMPEVLPNGDIIIRRKPDQRGKDSPEGIEI